MLKLEIGGFQHSLLRLSLGTTLTKWLNKSIYSMLDQFAAKINRKENIDRRRKFDFMHQDHSQQGP